MTERMVSDQEKQRKLERQNELRNMFLELFPHDRDKIIKGKFVDEIQRYGGQSPMEGDIFIDVSGPRGADRLDSYNISKSFFMIKKKDASLISADLYRDRFFITSHQYVLEDDITVSTTLKQYFNSKADSYFFTYVKELFMYPPEPREAVKKW